MWIFECRKKSEIIEVQYYHKSYNVKNSQVLTGCTITLSGYDFYEKKFLETLITKIGAHFQDKFARIYSKGLYLPSTHLVTDKPTGKKYDAAISWDVPVISKIWLLECAKNNSRVPESPFLISNYKGKFSFMLCVCKIIHQLFI